jgi:hypothetical protein
MSDIPHDWRDQLDIRAQIARIDRDIAENAKLRAEAQKFRRERWIVPVTVAGALLAAIVARLPEILRALGLAG